MTSLGRAGAALMVALLTLTLAPVGAASASPAPKSRDRQAEPIVIAHRGASGYRPEHTLAAYKLAINTGADFIEPDVVSTKDGHLVARHENNISDTTNVAEHPEFASLKTTKVIDGVSQTGWFTEDFTLAQLKTLRAIERLPDVRPGNTRFNGRFQVPTLDEVFALAKSESKRLRRTIGVYPETKHPTYFDSIGLSLEEPLVASLKRHRLNRAGAPVLLQSFETGNLRELNRMTRARIVQLVDASGAPWDLEAAGDSRTYADLVTPAGLRDIATYADGLGANKFVVIPRDANGAAAAPTPVVYDAHAAGLFVHIWTLRAENQFMARNFWRGTDPNALGDLNAEIRAFLDTGVDGVFSDHPDIAVDARDQWVDDAR